MSETQAVDLRRRTDSELRRLFPEQMSGSVPFVHHIVEAGTDVNGQEYAVAYVVHPNVQLGQAGRNSTVSEVAQRFRKAAAGGRNLRTTVTIDLDIVEDEGITAGTEFRDLAIRVIQRTDQPFWTGQSNVVYGKSPRNNRLGLTGKPKTCNGDLVYEDTELVTQDELESTMRHQLVDFDEPETAVEVD